MLLLVRYVVVLVLLLSDRGLWAQSRLGFERRSLRGRPALRRPLTDAASLRTKILQTRIRRLKTSGKLPVHMRIPPLKLKILFESNRLIS